MNSIYPLAKGVVQGCERLLGIDANEVHSLERKLI